MTKLICGVDEAGKGPVIGSLFIAAVVVREEDLDKLETTGIKDSKLLSHKKRVELSEKIRKLALKWKVIQVKPQEIDEAVMSQDHMNLNWLEAHKTAELLNTLRPDVAYIDCPSPNIKAYKGYLSGLLKKKNIELIVEHKCDLNRKICSASSIIAKCAREDEMDKIKKEYGNTGPGYTSNPVTQEFLKNNWDKHPEIFRKSWISWKNHTNGKEQKKLGEFEK